ncbi:MAG: outer membrane beta-barrel protein [Gemmatimonadaceae bacterium]
MIRRYLLLPCLALALSASALHAQRGSQPLELGIDGGVLFGLDNPGVTIVSLPLQEFRIGYFYNNSLELEPRFSVNSIHGGGNSFTTYSFEIGALFLPSGDRAGKGLYLRPFLGVTGFHDSAAGSDNNGYAGVGFGVKIPFSDRRLATRLEANYSHVFSNGGANQIGLLIGLSYFTR